MARLIDADALLENQPKGCYRTSDWINDAPTIDAIPVEWIRNIKENLPESIEKMGLDAVLILWAQEQEAR